MSETIQEPYPHKTHTHCDTCHHKLPDHDILCAYAAYEPEDGMPSRRSRMWNVLRNA